MQLIKLKVENFKSLTSVDISGFSTINFIHGYNNSGKSNFLKLLQLLFSRKTIEGPEEYFDENGVQRQRSKVVAITPFWNGYIYNTPFIFTKNNRDKSIKFDVQLLLKNTEFPHSDKLLEAGYLYGDRDSTPIIISGEIISINQNDSEIILKEVKLKGQVIYSQTEGAAKFFEKPDNSPLANQEDIFTDIMDVFNDCVMLVESERYFGKEILKQDESDVFRSDNFKNWLYNVSIDADKYEKFSGLIKFLDSFNITSKVSKVLEKNLSNYPFTSTRIGFSKFKEEIEVMLENSVGRFPLKNYGTGVQQIFFILSKLFDTKAKIILIEELELNLSPEYQELIVNNLQNFVAEEKISQVFFTSHSDYLNRNDFKVFEVSIDEIGNTTIKSSTYDGLKQLRRTYMNFAETGNVN